MAKAEILLIVLMSFVSASIQDDDANYNPTTDGSVELTMQNFKSDVLNSNDGWFVIFDMSGPGCSNCASYSELVKKSFPFLKEKKIKVGFVDFMRPENRELITAYKIPGFPTVYIFGHDKTDPIKFPNFNVPGEQIADIADYVLNKPTAAKGQCGKDSVQNVESNTYELTDENFEEVVLKCEEPWIVNFFTPGSKLCTQFTPHFEAAAKEFKGQLKFGSLYQLGSKVGKKFGVTFDCTVKLFPSGNKNGKPVDYNKGQHGPYMNSNLIPWIKTSLAAGKPAPDINELTSQSVLDTKCISSGVASCIFFFTESSDHCNSECQSIHLNQLKQLANDTKAEHWAWFLTTQGKQQEFEQAFGIKSFPGVVAVDLKHKTFSTKSGSKTAAKTKEFIGTVSSGIVPTKNLPPSGLPAVKA